MIRPKPSDNTQLLVIGLVACSMLLHEILLTRICALRLQFHFAFLVISNCLLGMGAAGTLLSLKHEQFFSETRLWLTRFCWGYLIALLGTYVFLVSFPLPADLSISNARHLLALSLFNLVGALPLFFSGLVIGLLLSANAERAGRLYAVDLSAAGLGCIACPTLLPLVGAGGVFTTSALLAFIACIALEWYRAGKLLRSGAVALAIVGLALVPRVDTWLPVTSKAGEVGPDQHIRSVWTSNSRIDLVTSARCDWPQFMRGKVKTVPLPRECAQIAQDATAATTISNYSDDEPAREGLKRTMYAAAYRLKREPQVLVIGLGGANDVWTAKASGARSVRAIELNWPIVDIHKHVLRRYSRRLVEDSSVTLVADEGRSALMRDRNQYDVIQMTGIDTWTALASGAYVLAENYLYTREAIAAMYLHLKPDGILQISRFSLEAEAMRMVSNIHAALESMGGSSLEHSIMALSAPDVMMALQIKKGVFTDAEQDSTAAFAQENGLEVVYLPGHPRPGLVDAFIRSPDKQRTIDAYPLNITPTEDDRPYFFNFLRWQDPLASFGHIDVAPSVSQGNPAFILIQLLISILLSAGLIVLPLARSQGFPQRSARPFLWYFSALGFGFIMIEVAVMQKLTLFLGEPVYSLTVTLCALLIATGLGSLLIGGRIDLTSRRIVFVPIGIAIYLGLLNVGLPLIVAQLIELSLPLRITVTVLLLAPLGILLGVPFAYGLRVAERIDRRIAAWGWAVNGCLSVVGSIVAVVISMNFGFSVVLWFAAVVYPLAFMSLHQSWTMAPKILQRTQAP
jgi:spermidine synthase